LYSQNILIFFNKLLDLFFSVLNFFFLVIKKNLISDLLFDLQFFKNFKLNNKTKTRYLLTVLSLFFVNKIVIF